MSHPTTPHDTFALGEIIRSFKPGAARLAAGTLFAVILIGAGPVFLIHTVNVVRRYAGRLPFAAEHEMSWLMVGLMVAVAIGLSVGGVFLWRYVQVLRTLTVELCAGGLRVVRGEARDDVPWKQFDAITETIVYERAPIVKGAAKMLVPIQKSMSYELTTKDNKSFRYNADSLQHIAEFGKLLRERATTEGVRWETVEVSS